MVNVGKVSVIRDGGTPKERARKLVEEAAEAFSAWERFDRADAIGCSIKSAWYYTTPCAHERADTRKNGGLLIMKIKLDEMDNDAD